MKINLSVVALAFLLKSGQALETLDEYLMDLSLRAAELSKSLNLMEEVPGTSFYVDEPDAALFLKENNYCFAIFRGTKPRIDDWLSNLDPFEGEVCSPSGHCCKTRRGFQQAYDLPGYKYSLEDQVRSCKNDCPECTVVFTGHSQGAAIAAVAAVAMDDLDPTVITFGQPGTIVGDCLPINADKYYRFVNAVTDELTGIGLDYDPVPCLHWNTDHMGHLIVMGQDDQNVVYYGDGEGPSTFQFGWSISAHRSVNYLAKLFTLRQNAPLSTEGWRRGFACSVDEECASPSHCVNNQCHQGLNGDSCQNDEDCDSERCAGFITGMFAGECKPQLEAGGVCSRDAVCLSGKCNRLFRCEE